LSGNWGGKPLLIYGNNRVIPEVDNLQDFSKFTPKEGPKDEKKPEKYLDLSFFDISL